MAKPLLPDDLWAEIEPLLPSPKPRRYRYPGRKPIDNRRALTGILFVLKSRIPWEMLPQEMGGDSGMTCWRRLREWQQAGVWEAIHHKLLERLEASDRIDWSQALVDSASIRAVGGGECTGPNPTDRARPGSKHHLITDARGIPLHAVLSGANAHDVTQLIALVDGITPVRSGRRGRPRHRPERVQGDRAYDSRAHRAALRTRNIQPQLARRNTPHGSGLGTTRWVVERSLAWLHQFRRLQVHFERRADIHEAFLFPGTRTHLL
ncbi:transposase IS402 [Marichromatium purpuratum 984]|uniref:Transposase IS402 n=1 Tax=Marichromatium purpuratum 984 TaxID=765910 RepID=W0DZV4_MARPU|nr:transposase IS402 [Marichromatium purpuratum 984]